MLTAKQKKLVEDNMALIFFTLKKYNYPVDEFYDLGAIGLCKAAAKYDPEKGAAFSSYAVQSIRNELSHWKTIDGRYLRPAISIDEPLPDGNGCLAEYIPGDFSIEDVDDSILARDCLRKANVKDEYKEICREWSRGKTMIQIAGSRGCSRSWIQHVTSKTLKACKQAAAF